LPVHIPDRCPAGSVSAGSSVRPWARRPKALLLDEPFSALDAATRSALRQELLRLRDTFSMPIIHVTHDLAEAATLASFTELGKGALVVAWPKGKSFSALADLAKPEVKRVSMPYAAKAIYGIAGKEALAKAGLAEGLKDKIFIMTTVPQVMTYVVTGEVDAGLANLTDTLGQVGVSLLLGGDIIGRTNAVSLEIYNAVFTGDFPRAGALALLLALVSVGLTVLLKKVGRE